MGLEKTSVRMREAEEDEVEITNCIQYPRIKTHQINEFIIHHIMSWETRYSRLQFALTKKITKTNKVICTRPWHPISRIL